MSDEIIATVNQPVKLKSQSSYTFILNAENISSSIVDYPFANVNKSKLFLSLVNYEGGEGELNIYNYERRLIYQRYLGDNIDGITADLEGVSPNYLEFNFENFTGKIKFQLTKLN